MWKADSSPSLTYCAALSREGACLSSPRLGNISCGAVFFVLSLSPSPSSGGGFLEFRGETHLEMVIRRRGHREARLGNGSFQIVLLLSQPCRFASTADSWDFKESKETGLKVKARIPHLEGLHLRRFSLEPRRSHTP